MIMDEVSARINQILEERKMTKFDLYKKCEDVSRASVYNAANGRNVVSLDTIEHICKGLDISVSRFFSWEDDNDIHLTEDGREIIMACRGSNDGLLQRLKGYIDGIKVDNSK